MKKITALFLSIILVLVSATVPTIAFADVSELCDNAEYLELVTNIQAQMKARNTTVSYSVTTTDERFEEVVGDSTLKDELFKEFYFDLFTQNTDDAALGDYLFHSLNKTENLNLSVTRTNSGTKLTFSGTFGYFTTKAQEDALARFVADFNSEYLSNAQTEYDITKTIYDFIVRYVAYDNELYEDSKNGNFNYPKTGERYKSSHSAYGAVFAAYADGESDYDLTAKTNCTGEPIVSTYEQGLSVCEGYAKLFYYLCTLNGVECHIVDGDYTAGQTSDSHEWNYVRFHNDSNTANNEKWFLIDTTFASQKSTFVLEDVCYDFLLRGTDSEAFDVDHHQQPYANFGKDVTAQDEEEKREKEQLYDWVNDERFTVSKYDYEFAPSVLTTDSGISSYIVRRTANYGDGDKILEILYKDGKMYEIAYDDDGNCFLEETNGFGYNGKGCKFELIVPYLVDGVYEIQGDVSNIKACKTYNLTVVGAQGTSLTKPYSIIPLSMADESGNYDEDACVIVHSAEYIGSDIMYDSTLKIVDCYGNVLVENRDYSLSYKNSKNAAVTSLVDIDNYTVHIQFIGNYCDSLEFNFSILPINLSEDNDQTTYIIPYFPVGIFEDSDKITADYFLSYIMSGDAKLEKGTDFTADASNGALTFGAKGTITIHGINGSHCTGTKVVNYMYGNPEDDSTRYSISNLNFEYADTNSTNVYYYTGKEIKPTVFDNLDDFVKKGVDYEIVSYSNNINAGTATVKIRGINGCKGEKSFKFIINKVSLNNATITPTVNGTTVSLSITSNGRTLVKNTDYTQATQSTSTGYTITITGKGNYTGTRVVNVLVDGGGSDPTPTPTVRSGWQKISGKWYYYKDGAPLKWRQKIGSKYYYFNGSGVMQTGWIKGGCWMYAASDGALKTGWQKIGGVWYWFKSDGSMVTGWQKISGKWYFFNSSGSMKTGWLKSGGKWYYFNSSGVMLANTSAKIGSKTYKFNSSGVCLNP